MTDKAATPYGAAGKPALRSHSAAKRLLTKPLGGNAWHKAAPVAASSAMDGSCARSISTHWRTSLLIAPMLMLAGCSGPSMAPSATLEPLPLNGTTRDAAPARVNGPVGTTNVLPGPITSSIAPATAPSAAPAIAPTLGHYTLNFTDLDVRDAAAQLLGDILHVNYTIDPAVRGTVTLHTSGTTTRPQLIATLQSLLTTNNATLVETAGFYRVMPSSGANGAGGIGTDVSGLAVPLRYASAPELVKVLQPFLQKGGRIAADPGSNTLIVGGDAAARDALAALIRAFDVDAMAGQSYALFPVSAGDVQNSANALQAAFRSQNGGALAGVVRVVPMQSINSLLVIASHRTYIEDAKRIYALIDRMRLESVRGWHVYYLQNSRSNDIAYVLQQAFTPGNVTAAPPTPDRSASPGSRGGSLGSGFGGGSSLGRNGSSGGGNPGNSRGSSPTPEPAPATGNDNPDALMVAAGNPLLGGLGGAPDIMSGNANASQGMRVIANNPSNAILIYGTTQETATAEAMLRKLDVLPLQVQIEAVIAEVTLNDDLRYGTQFFFKSRGVNVILDNAAQNVANLAGTALVTPFPGIALGGSSTGGAPFVLSALQAVTQVNVLSSPQLLVMDNQPARLQVGQLVPYLTQSGQSTLTVNAPIINSNAKSYPNGRYTRSGIYSAR